MYNGEPYQERASLPRSPREILRSRNPDISGLFHRVKFNWLNISTGDELFELKIFSKLNWEMLVKHLCFTW